MLDRNFRVTLIITLKKLCYTHESTSSYPHGLPSLMRYDEKKKVIGFYKHVTHTTHFWIGTFSRLPDGPNYIITKVEERRRDEIRILGLHGKKEKDSKHSNYNTTNENRELRNSVLNEPDLSLITFNPRRSC